MEYSHFKFVPVVFLLAQCNLALSASPGTPLPAVTVFQEDFENVAGQSVTPDHALSLADYVSVAKDFQGNPVRYTAEGRAIDTPGPLGVPFWLNANFCNGMWVGYRESFPSGTLPPPYVAGANTYCGTAAKGADNWSYLRALANALGKISGQTTSNHVIAAYTEMPYNPPNATTPALVQLKLAAPVSLPPGGRFLTFSVAMGATNCKQDVGNNANSVDPQISFYQVLDPSKSSLDLNGSNVVKLNSTSKSPCGASTYTDEDRPGSTIGTNKARIRVAQLDGDLPVKVAGTTVAMQLVNEKSGGYGNDAAFDNLLILDMTPRLDKEFAPKSVDSKTATVMTFTITNTQDLYVKAGWNFSDRLPAGLEFAGAPATNCAAATMSTTADTLKVEDGTIGAGVASCTVTVPVKLIAGTVVPAGGLKFLNQPAPAAPGAGEVVTGFISPPGTAELEVTPVADMIASPTPPENFAIGVPGSITTTCVNGGPDVAIAATCEVDRTGLPSGAKTVCTPLSGTTNLNPGEKISCVTSFTMSQAGSVSLTTTAGSTSTDPDPLNNRQPATVTAVTPAADMQASAPTDTTTTVGTPTSIITACKNLGPNVALNATCTVTGVPDATTSCTPSSPQASLPVGESMICTTSFTPKTATPVTLTTTIGTTTSEVNSQNNSAVTTVKVESAAPAPVPTLGEWALMLLSVLLTGAGVLRLRRTRVA
ncbi:IPTL-CTERM sorting domain-containing protein [Diaphorobacter caeni]|uniref:IPTL-CTERM sorting domain-containing protein n=1 Tax=Diaphorobacter caeni TaxID=2784387 RepID=UPI00188F4620|nr:IPTL-CTERM sorting domain-containing protein [Diaphorobacter caeni]MBF5004675.1 IPTL-CTERM sorting domain-containing protein [Diaphorobacter caeni]